MLNFDENMRALQLMNDWPRISAGLAAFTLSNCGDAIAQSTVYRSNEFHSTPLDYRRSFAQGCFSALYASLIYAPWVRMLDKLFGRAMTNQSALLKSAVDNVLLCPFVGLPSFFLWTSLFHGHTWHDTATRLQANYLDTLIGSWAVWGPVQFAAYRLAPLHARVACMYCGELAWAATASFMSRRSADSVPGGLPGELL